MRGRPGAMAQVARSRYADVARRNLAIRAQQPWSMYHLLRPHNGFDHRNSRKLFLLHKNLKKVCKVSKENFDQSCRFIRFKYGI